VYWLRQMCSCTIYTFTAAPRTGFSWMCLYIYIHTHIWHYSLLVKYIHKINVHKFTIYIINCLPVRMIQLKQCSGKNLVRDKIFLGNHLHQFKLFRNHLCLHH
jgi:hypothetical protein